MPLNRAHLAEFSALLANARKVTVLTGAGVSAESGIPTFRGEGGLWRDWSATELATPEAFTENPSLVWEFYHYRRTIVSKALPNAAHLALGALEQRCNREGKEYTLLTQNIDELHKQAGSTNVVELHGSLWKTRCCHCEDVQENRCMPICPALNGKPAAGYAPMVRALGGEVAEFNIEDTPASRSCRFKFRGPSATTLPEALGISLDQLPQTSMSLHGVASPQGPTSSNGASP